MNARSRILALTETLAFAVVYFCSGKLGLSMAFVNASATAVWPPTGLALAFLLWRGRRCWPGVFLGAFLVNLTTQGSVPVTLGIAIGNTLEAWFGAWFVARYANGLDAFETTRDAFRFVLYAALLSTAISPTFGVTSLCAGGFASWPRFGTIWLTWWLGDLVSNLIIAPLLVVWLGRNFPKPNFGQLAESAVLLVLVTALGGLIFSEQTFFAGLHLPLEFLMLPLLLWAAFRFGPRGAISAVFVMSGIALWGTLHKAGPFVCQDPNESLLLLQAFVGTASMTALFLALVVNERKRAQQTLMRSRDDLEIVVNERTAKLRDLVAELESFSYSITHDMRGPLRAMQNFALLLEEDCKDLLPDFGKEYCRRIRDAARRMDLLIQDSLDYSRVLREEMQLHPVELAKVLRGIVESYPNLQEPGVRIDLEIHDLWVLGNESALVQCFSNLLGNAVKFVAVGTKPHVRVFAQRNERTTRIWIVDNGIGIPDIGREKLFAMFQRLHHEREYPGTGIGLAIVRKAVERMNGSVGVESESGKGSRFWVDLPSSAQSLTPSAI